MAEKKMSPQMRYYYRNQEVCKARRRKYGRKINLKSKFGITEEQYDAMLAAQNNVCAICKQPEMRRGRWKESPPALAVDHCHTTGKIRGLLCAPCNTAIGLMKESPAVLIAALEYIKHYEEESPAHTPR